MNIYLHKIYEHFDFVVSVVGGEEGGAQGKCLTSWGTIILTPEQTCVWETFRFFPSEKTYVPNDLLEQVTNTAKRPMWSKTNFSQEMSNLGDLIFDKAVRGALYSPVPAVWVQWGVDHIE